MQRVSNRMGYTISHMYSQAGSVGTYYGPRLNVNYEDNNAFPLFFKVDLQGDRVELPMFAKDLVQSHLLNSLQSGARGDVVVPFIRDSITGPAQFRTADALIRYLIENPSNFGNMYSVVKTNKDEVYYGANGLLFDNDMNLLFLSSVECDIDGTIIKYRKVKAYIHPSVFYSEGTVEKCLINKVIPYSLKEGVTVYGGFQSYNVRNLVNYDDPDNYRTQHKAVPEVVVTDIKDKFFYKPTLPSVSFSNDDVNEVLDRNLEDVFNIMRV